MKKDRLFPHRLRPRFLHVRVRKSPARLARFAATRRAARPTWPLLEGIVSVLAQDARHIAARCYEFAKSQLGHFL
jgi:hypothetical protein